MIYMDHNSTTHRIRNSFLGENLDLYTLPLNPSSIHFWGRRAREYIENARIKIAKILDIDTASHEIIFTSSATEANNLVINSFSGSDVFISEAEHLSIYEYKKNQNVYTIRVDGDALLDLEDLRKKIVSAKPKSLLSVILANNETGAINDLKEISKVAKENGLLVHSDCVQAVGKIKYSFKELGIDFASISSHKIGGPSGVSILVAKKGFIRPMIIGGGQEKSLRSGTENVLGAVEFADALEVATNNLDVYLEKASSLRNILETRLEGRAVVASKNTARLPNTSMLIMPNVNSQTQMIIFDTSGFMVSNGSACSSGKIKESHVLKNMGYDEKFSGNGIRVSLGINNTESEVLSFCDKWEEVFSNFNK